MHRVYPQILHNNCFQFLLGITVVPREIKNKGYAILFLVGRGGGGVGSKQGGKASKPPPLTGTARTGQGTRLMMTNIQTQTNLKIVSVESFSTHSSLVASRMFKQKK